MSADDIKNVEGEQNAVELSNVSSAIYECLDGGTDDNTYDHIMPSTAETIDPMVKGGATNNNGLGVTTRTSTAKTTKLGEKGSTSNSIGQDVITYTPSSKVIVAAVLAMFLVSVIVAIGAVVVYHVINSKTADSAGQTWNQGNSSGTSTIRPDSSSDWMEKIMQLHQLSSALKLNVSSVSDRITALARTLEDRLHFTDERQENLTTKRTRTNPREPVGFLAYMSGGNTQPTGNQTLIFNTVLQNFGQAYNSSDGLFTPPVSGLYHFSVQICMTNHFRLSFQIVSTHRVYAASSYPDNFDATCHSLSTTAGLDVGERIWVRCILEEDPELGTDTIDGSNPNELRTMFSGLLVHTVAFNNHTTN